MPRQLKSDIRLSQHGTPNNQNFKKMNRSKSTDFSAYQLNCKRYISPKSAFYNEANVQTLEN